MEHKIEEYSPTWKAVDAWGKELMKRYTEDLIAKEDPEARGAIKVLQKMLKLPEQQNRARK